MDQGMVVIDGDRRTWTPLRVLLLALGAIAGGLLLSLVLGGPAHADAPVDPQAPAATSPVTPLLGRVAGVVTDTVQVILPSTPATPTAVQRLAAPVAPLVHAAASGTDALIAATPVLPTLLGPAPVQTLLDPIVGPVLGPVLGVTASEQSASPTAATPTQELASGTGTLAAPAATSSEVPAAASITSPPAAPRPSAPTPPAPDSATGTTYSGTATTALLTLATLFLLLAVRSLRRGGLRLPAPPALGADVSPD